jgi:hypothetical protein
MLGMLLVLSPVYSQTNNKVLPDSFKVKGFHLDLRVQVMKMPALKAFALKLSNAGVNTLVMEWEASYPYSKHNIISSKYAYSREEVKSFIAYCNSLHIDVIPLQQSFGHVEYILKHYRYKELREDQKDYSQVNPLEEEKCKAFFTDLYKDMIATHTSQYIHIGGDETYLLGHSKASQAKVAAVGKGRLYGDYLKILCDIVISLGKRPIVWADIALNYPDALKLLPKETILVDWNYGWALNRFGDHQKLMDSGFEIWGSPAIRSHPDNYFLTQWSKHFQNIETFMPQARALGYKGMVMTSWSTSGLYSSVFESSSDILDLHAIRRVYPLTGFNMLIEAYFQALKSPKFETASFIADYTNKQYGFNREEASAFWNALKLAPYEVNEGKVTGTLLSVKQLLDSANQSATILNTLKPVKNKEEFKHYQLMADIRVMYLKVIGVESVMNSTEEYLSRTAELLAVLNSLGVNELNKRFTALNKNTLHASEIETENTLRNSRVQLLKDKLLVTNQSFAR